MLKDVKSPLTTAIISRFILDRGYTSYFNMQEALSELSSSELIKRLIIVPFMKLLPLEGKPVICFIVRFLHKFGQKSIHT